MRVFEINGTIREKVGKSETKKLRKQDLVPCEIYGGEKNIHFYAHENDFRKLIYTNELFTVNVKLGKESYNLVMKDIQFHPVTDKILHIDFLEIFDDKRFKFKIPIELEGFAKGVQAGGKLYKEMRYLRVKGLLKDMPEVLKVNVEELEIGKTIKVRELNIDDLEILDPPSNLVASVKVTRVAKSLEEEEGEGEEGEGTEEEKTEEQAAE